MQEKIPHNSELVDTYTYEVDAYDTICRTGSHQLRSDKHSEIEYTATNDVFDSMFSDEKTLLIFRNILNQVRTNKNVISFPYRCDTETLCSYYRLTVSISTTHHVLFYNKLLGIDSRQNGIRWKPKKSSDHDAIPLCSICNRLCKNEQWMDLQEMIELKLWSSVKVEMPCSYTVCSSCERGIDHRLGESIKQNSMVDI